MAAGPGSGMGAPGNDMGGGYGESGMGAGFEGGTSIPEADFASLGNESTLGSPGTGVEAPGLMQSEAATAAQPESSDGGGTAVLEQQRPTAEGDPANDPANDPALRAEMSQVEAAVVADHRAEQAAAGVEQPSLGPEGFTPEDIADLNEAQAKVLSQENEGTGGGDKPPNGPDGTADGESSGSILQDQQSEGLARMITGQPSEADMTRIRGLAAEIIANENQADATATEALGAEKSADLNGGETGIDIQNMELRGMPGYAATTVETEEPSKGKVTKLTEIAPDPRTGLWMLKETKTYEDGEVAVGTAEGQSREEIEAKQANEQLTYKDANKAEQEESVEEERIQRLSVEPTWNDRTKGYDCIARDEDGKQLDVFPQELRDQIAQRLSPNWAVTFMDSNSRVFISRPEQKQSLIDQAYEASWALNDQTPSDKQYENPRDDGPVFAGVGEAVDQYNSSNTRQASMMETAPAAAPSAETPAAPVVSAEGSSDDGQPERQA